jgi:hypothetical protein
MTIIREDVMNVLGRMNFARPLTDEQQLFLLRVSEDELRLMLEQHGLCEEALRRRASTGMRALSLLAPYARREDGRWRTVREALDHAPREVAETAVRLLGEAGHTVDYVDPAEGGG